MAAPRKYTDAQRQAMYRLYEVGIGPTEIARKCASGEAGVSPFEIPRKTCEAIVKDMEQAAAQRLPTTVIEAESAEAVDRFPARIARIVDAEINRLDSKQKQRGLTSDDYDRLRKASDLSLSLQKRLNRRTPASRSTNGARQPAGSQPAQETALEKLAREQGERVGVDDHLLRAHTPPAPVESNDEPDVPTTPDPPPQTPLDAVRRVAAKHGVDLRGMEDRPVERSRQEAARKARAALGLLPLA